MRTFVEAVEHRRSMYAISKESTRTEAEIEALLLRTTARAPGLHCSSARNMMHSGRL